MDKYTFTARRSKCLVLCALFACAPAFADDPVFSPAAVLGPGDRFVEQDGEQLFRSICQSCHMPDAKGARGAGQVPALAANPKLASAVYPTVIVLKGLHAMPALGPHLSDAQVADVVNYVRTHFDNHYNDVLTVEDVKKLR